MTDGPVPSDTRSGKGADVFGNPVIDPTRNVLDLVSAAIKRQDDLRFAELKGQREYIDAKLTAFQHELALRSEARIEQKADTRAAIDAAFSAAEKAIREQQTSSEKAIEKSERSTAEQSRQQSATFAAELRGLSDAVGALKDRVVIIEAMKVGSQEVRTSQRSDVGMIVGVVGVIMAAISFLFTVGVLVMGK